MRREGRKAPSSKRQTGAGSPAVAPKKKLLISVHGEITVPPYSPAARQEAYGFIERLRDGEMLTLPYSRPMPSIGRRCHELRVTDENVIHRIIYYLQPNALVILEVFVKKTEQTPLLVIRNCQARLARYQAACREAERRAN